jgi:hypothetical protein
MMPASTPDPTRPRHRPWLRLAVLGLGVAVVGVVSAACSSGDIELRVSPAPTSVTTTSTTAPPVLWPLTGLPAGDESAVTRSALTVKIDNAPEARPHASLTRADMVYEVWVEGITRFAAIYHSDVPDRAGPVRSARSTDVDLVANLGTPLLVWSGGNANVMAEVGAAAAEGILVDAGYDRAGGDYSRDGSRYAPHNMYANLVALRDNLGLDGTNYPTPLYPFRTTAEPGGDPVPGISISFGPGASVQYVWDPDAGCARRFQDGRPFDDEDGSPVCPRNVVVQFTDYGPSTADSRSPQAYTVGGGGGVVFSEGRLSLVNWNRPGRLDGPNLTDVSGLPVELTPGITWVAMPPTGQETVPLSPEAAAALLGR